MFDRLLQLLFPRTCLSCGKFGRYCCSSCEKKLVRITTPICPVCTRPAMDGATHPRCMTRYSLDGLVSCFRYTGLIKKAIKQLKYGKVSDIAAEIGSLCSHEITNSTSHNFRSFTLFLQTRPVVIPIPLHWRKKQSRWFNQSELLGKHVAEHIGVEMNTDLLVRSIFTKPQTGQTKEDRLRNMKGVFSIETLLNRSIPKNIILIDDVWTTGATMRGAGNVLKRAGVQCVWGVTVAR